MKLGLKLPLAFVAALSLAACAGLFGMFGLNQSLDLYETTVQENVANERAVADMLVDFKEQVQEWKNTLLRGKDAARLEKHWGAFEKQERLVNEGAKKLIAALPQGESKALIEKFERAHATMGIGYRKGFEAFKTASFDATVGDAAVAGVDREPAKLLDDAGDKIAAQSASVSNSAAVSAKRATVAAVSLLAFVCAIGIVGGFMFSRTITRPLSHAVDTARAVASGDLAYGVHPKGNDEVADLLRALLDMQKSLSVVVTDVRQNSEHVATASAQIAAGNNDLSARTEQQASALQQTAASMEEMSATVRQNAENAQQANQLAMGASTVAVSGGETVSSVISTMKGINESSRKIVEIIGVIDGIAFQTNILALNAAVEAARAGEQGRGFAVVATEVRNLAQRSAEAAKEIKTLISTSVERVEAGTVLVDRAGVTMTEIVQSIRRVTDIVAEISAATSEQSSGVSQIGEAVTQMDRATQQNSALVEESAAAAESLKLQAHALVQVVAVFKLTPGEQPAGRSAPAQHIEPAPRSTTQAAPKAAPGTVDRRGPNRAKNVVRPAFKPATPPAVTPAAPSAKSGTDDWETF